MVAFDKMGRNADLKLKLAQENTPSQLLTDASI